MLQPIIGSVTYELEVNLDLLPAEKAFNITTRQFEEFVGHQFSYGPVLKERELLFPIPTDEIRNNYKLVQNKGY